MQSSEAATAATFPETFGKPDIITNQYPLQLIDEPWSQKGKRKKEQKEAINK